MNNRLGWVLPVPFLIFFAGIWIDSQTQNEVRAQMGRAQTYWRQAHYGQAVESYRSIAENYPMSRYADEALWEVATINYVNLYDIDQAGSYFLKLVTEYPLSPLVGDAYRKLAEIYEMELEEPALALEYLEHSLGVKVAPEISQQVFYKMGNIHLKLNQFDAAFAKFQLLVEGKEVGHLAEQALVRMGTICQIKNEHKKSIEYFELTLTQTRCSECSLTARLGLVENFESLGDIGRAAATARAIPDSEYSKDLKQRLLQRLNSKAKYYTYATSLVK